MNVVTWSLVAHNEYVVTWSLVAQNEYIVTWSLVAQNESLAHKHCRCGADLMFHVERRG